MARFLPVFFLEKKRAEGLIYQGIKVSGTEETIVTPEPVRF
jgi:hypothetical protein